MGLRVGLTGGLGSGKSTVATMLAAHGAIVFSADELARGLMQPGEAVFDRIVDRFGREVVLPDGTLDRPALAQLAFAGGRVEELNAIVHPATIALQAKLTRQVFASQPDAIVVVESALIFETKYSETKYSKPDLGARDSRSQPGPNDWHNRFDRLILVTAPEELKIARFIARTGSAEPEAQAALAVEARRRLSRMVPDQRKAPLCDFVITNDGSREQLREQVNSVWRTLRS